MTTTFTSSGTWTAPAGVTSVTVEAWGGGGGGGGNPTNQDGAGGGGGGAYSRTTTIAVIPGNTYTVTVGAGGTGGAGTGGAGGDSWFSTIATILAKGGTGGLAPVAGAGGVSGLGGSASSGIGTTKYSGGNGGTGRNSNQGRGGPGGSSAGTAANGTNGPATWTTATAAAPPTGGGIGGNGGNANSENGFAPVSGYGGGGGGGAERAVIGGDGAGGLVTITYPLSLPPVIDFRLDECQWSGATDEAIDSSGNGYDGTPQGNSTIDPSNSQICRSGQFLGNGDYLQTAQNLTPLQGTASLSFWINTTQVGNNTGWLAPGVSGIEEAGGGDDIFWGWIDAGGNIGISVGNDYSTKSTIPINDGLWHHVVLTRDASNENYQIFIDRQLNTSGTSTENVGIVGNSFSSIGRIEDTGGTPANFIGHLDEVKVFNSTLTLPQVQDIYDSEIAGNNYDGSARSCLACPIADFHLDECAYTGAAGEVIDSVAGNYDSQAYNSLDTDSPGQIERFANITSNTHHFRTSIPIPTNWAITAWFRTPFLAAGTTPQRYYVFAAVAGGGDIFYMDENNNFRWGVYSSGGTTDGTFQFGTLAAGWHHMAVVGQGGQTALYIDNVLTDTINRQTTGTLTYIGTSFDDVNLTVAQGFGAPLDELLVFNAAIPASAIGTIYTNQLAGNNFNGTSRPPASCGSCALDHFTFVTDTAALACPETRAAATITARCSDNSIKADYSGTVQLTSTPSGGAYYDVQTGGAVITSTTYAPADSGSKTLYLYFGDENTVSVTATDNAPLPAVSSTSGTIDFRAYGFLSDLSNQTSCATTTVTLTAFGQRPGDTGCNIIEGFAGNKNIKAWFDHNDPASGTVDAVIDHDGGGFTDPLSLPTSEPAGNNIMINFVNGQGNFDLSYDDAGLLDLNLLHDDAPYDAPPVDIDSFFSPMLYSDSYLVKPDHFLLRATKTDGTTDINTATDSGTPIHTAGTDFQLTIQAVCADSSTITENYIPTSAEVWLERTGPATATGSEGTLTLLNLAGPPSLDTVLPGTAPWLPTWVDISTLFDDGKIHDPDDLGPPVVNYDFATTTFNEVGLFRLHIQDSDYQGTTLPEQTLDIGRFTPDHFDVSISPAPPILSNTCATFTYLGSKFDWASIPSITVTAMNGAAPPVQTQNYEDTFWKLDTTLSYTYVDGNAPAAAAPLTPATSSQTITGTVNCNGTRSIPLNEDDGDDTNSIYDGFNYTRPVVSSPVSPFSPDVTLNISSGELTDSDGICFDSGTGCQAFPVTAITGTNLRHGKIQIFNNFGPETQDITNSPFEAQYYDGTNWILNTDDNCSTGMSFCDSLGAGRVTNISDPLSGGLATLTLTTSGTFGEKLDVCTITPAWLTETNCAAPDMTCGEFTFGIYRGNDRIINWREIVR
ncbi:MAG: LamG domain-containing protein [Proteobacteria bacterium]|nr:LamG domain-containing protein [Pseudomonadota bacterium]